MESILGKYKYKGKTYYAYGDGGSVKNPVTGEWFPVVQYRPYYTWVCEETGESDTRENWDTLYLRERSDFINKFEKVPEEDCNLDKPPEVSTK